MRAFRNALKILVVAAIAGLTQMVVPPLVHAEVIVVPPGNRNDKRPRLAFLSVLWTAANQGSYEAKYRQIYGMLQKNQGLMGKIKQVSRIYGIDPIHMVGAIVGEHTYNVDGLDSLQGYYVKAAQYAKMDMTFSYKGETAAKFFQRPQFERCNQYKSSYEMWDCRSVIWRTKFQGKSVDGKRFPDVRIQRVFFMPGIAGQTFGLGQLSPVVALMVNDTVHAKSGLPLLDINDAAEVYETIMDPDRSIHYMAAQIRVCIDMYRNIAGFDITKNPGVTATLYNLGDCATRAREIRADNDARRKKGQQIAYPEENFYGWLVNDRLDQLRKLI